MGEYKVETRGLDELMKKLKWFPQKMKQLQKTGMDASLLVLWENVPPYPDADPNSSYRRTGTLGRSLGSSEAGGRSGGQPEIYQVKGLGSTNVEGRFGTRLSYAEHVIGEDPAWMHYRWWKLSSVLERSKDKIVQVWEKIATTAAKWLDSKTGGL